jgi:N-acetylglucosamine-6-phosphate deacetylase
MYSLKNGYYLSSRNGFVKGDILFDEEAIICAGPGGKGSEEAINIDIEGLKVIPGLIDIHTHGAIGHDVISASPSELMELAGFYAANAVTSFLPATVTADIKTICKAIENISTASKLSGISSSIEGVNIEGPYISQKFRGTHDLSYIKLPDTREFDLFKNAAGEDMKLLITVAPELPDCMEFIS